MDYWIFRLLLLPAVMYFAGLIWYKYPPKNRESHFGLRIREIKEDQEAWDFSQRYFGKAMMIMGIIFVTLTWVVAMVIQFRIPCIGETEAAQVAYTLFVLELAGMSFVAIETKRVVRKQFFVRNHQRSEQKEQ